MQRSPLNPRVQGLRFAPVGAKPTSPGRRAPHLLRMNPNLHSSKDFSLWSVCRNSSAYNALHSRGNPSLWSACRNSSVHNTLHSIGDFSLWSVCRNSSVCNDLHSDLICSRGSVFKVVTLIPHMHSFATFVVRSAYLKIGQVKSYALHKPFFFQEFIRGNRA